MWRLTRVQAYLIRHAPKTRVKSAGGLMGAIKTPLGAVLMLVITLILASLTVAASISGDLTAAAVSAAGLVVIVLIIAMLNFVGK